ncbi:MAG: hypothetical protein C0594_16315, partial [Marinilabiliales bacterium]
MEQTDKSKGIKQTNKKKKNPLKGWVIFLSVLVVLLLGSIATIAWYYFELVDKQEATEAKLSKTSSEKEKVTNDLENMLQQYEALETDNEEVQAELEAEKEKIKKLLHEIRNVKASNRNKIKMY